MKRFLLTLTVLSFSSVLAYSQAMPTATRRGDLQVGGAFVADFPDYTRHKFYGYGVYADLDLFEHFGIEGEYRQANDTTISAISGKTVPQYQRNIEGGIRYHRNYGRIAPYAKGMFGYAVMEYPPYPPPADQTIPEATIGYTFVAAGGGIDYTLTTHLALRADLEYQLWFRAPDSRLGYDYNAGTGGLPNGLSPIVYTGGIAWRFGSGNYVPRGGRRALYGK